MGSARGVSAFFLASAMAAGGGCGDPTAGPPDAAPPVDAQQVATFEVLAINDLHGAIETGAVPGAAYLVAQIEALRTPDTIVISAGDLIGASPLVSGLFHDEPTIEAMNLARLDAAGVGNHELDEGSPELRLLQEGGCHPVDGCQDGTPFTGAAFPFLAANVVVRATQETLFPPFEIVERAGIKIAIVGMTLENTPSVTVASMITDLEFKDEVETMDALLPAIRAAGAEVVVLALHQGGSQGGGFNDCIDLQGSINQIAANMDPAVVMIASGHSHELYNCTVDGRLLTSAGANGVFFTRATIDVDRATGTLVAATALNLPVDPNLTPDPTAAALVARYAALAAQVGDRVIGTITGDLTQAVTLAGESTVGDVVADAMLEAAPGAQLALMNAGGLRMPILFAATAPEPVDGQVRYREAYGTQPFSNLLTTIDVTGAQLVELLDRVSMSRPLLIAGGTYAWSASAPAGSRVVADGVTVGGVALDPARTYTVVVNSIVLDLVPAYTGLTGVGVDLDALVAHFGAHSPIAPPALDRITRTP
jgi:5'-nucleotidase